jgi:hypothetical protein
VIRTLNLILTATSVAALIGVYALKYTVEGTAGEKRGLEQAISKQESDLSLLQADWAFLNQPGHIEPIITRHADILGLGPVKQAQFGTIDSVPMRPAQPDDQALDALFQSLDAGVDPIDQILGEIN